MIEDNNKEIISSNISQNQGMGKLVIKTIAGLMLIAIALTLIIYGLKNISINVNDELNKTDNQIEQSLLEIKDTDFSDNLDIEYNDSSIQPAINQIDESISEIDNVLKEINKESDFKEIDNINFN